MMQFKLVDGAEVELTADDLTQQADDIARKKNPPQDVKMKRFENAIQGSLNNKAKSMGYDSIETAVSYADEHAVEKFQIEGSALRAWRSMVWNYVYSQLALVLSGQRSEPTVEEFLNELPTFNI